MNEETLLSVRKWLTEGMDVTGLVFFPLLKCIFVESRLILSGPQVL